MGMYFKEALNTITATPWELLKVRLFGKKVTAKDRGDWVTFRIYKGKYYLMDYGSTKESSHE